MSNNNNNDLVTFKIAVYDTKGNLVENRKFTTHKTIAHIMDGVALPCVLMYQDQQGDWISLRTQLDVDELFRSVVLVDNVCFLTARKTARNGNFIADSVSKTYQQTKPLLERVATEAKKAAEEVVVLGVRGASYVQNSWEKRHSGEISSQEKTAPPEQVPTPAPPQDESLGSRITSGAKRVVEEAVVLGVRAGTYIEHQIQQLQNPAVQEEQQQQQQQQQQQESEQDLPKEKQSGMRDSWVDLSVNFELEKHLADLNAMGFMDQDANKAALRKHSGDVVAAVAELLGE